MKMLRKLPLGKLKSSRGAILVVGLRILGAIFTYLNVILLARWLDGTDYGIFTLILSTATLAGFVTRFGTEIAIVRFLGMYRAQGKPALAEGVVRTSLKITLVASLIVALVFTLVVSSTSELSDRLWLYSIAAFLLYPAFTQNEVLSAILRSFGVNFAALAPKDILWRGSLLALAISGIWAGLTSPDVLMLVIAGSGIVITLLCFWQFLLQKRVRSQFAMAALKPEYDIPTWRKSALPLWFLLIARNLARTADVLIVGALLSVREAGIYFAVSRTAELLGFFLSSLNLLVGPAVARGHAKNDIQGVQRTLSLAALFLFVSTLGGMIVIAVFGKWILNVMGSEFANAYVPLIIMSVGQCINVFTGSSGVILNMTGNEAANMRILVSTMIFSLVLLAILATSYGLLGAAWASAIGMTTWNLGLWLAAKRLTPYEPSWIGIFKLAAKG
ncbi:hypothetical protein D6851_17175 [Altericroceibacterium spongiae]|uniref:Uncharacterized protein n=1 Tax=Altericroceibacterium spongiae TaxID=2320269 RepID=A0A420E937_9SPHN|nr:oligosaccharide flippase family protein [Altericroceibacterium spongiae]RKF15976.1 hypothetical protein D6851_17175 [Altericroceibacterium spongiae]